jgi:16S rRNA (cytosine967-C5)-methyltransferase
MMATARRIAIEALIDIDAGARANEVVPARLAASPLDQRDRAFVTEVAYGTCRMRRACDWLVDRHVKGRTDPEVRAALRAGAYQLLWMRVPAHAAVSATVAEVRGRGRGLVNAVLRKVAKEVSAGPPRWPDPATALSYPDWIVARLAEDLGPQEARAALAAMNEAPEMTARPDGYIQDLASQLVAAHVGAQPGERLLDLCAAPGGKATALAANADAVVAADVSWTRLGVVRANVDRLGLDNVVLVAADGRAPPWPPRSFDRVLVDAPCSGLGVLRRRPDARWRVQPGDIRRLAALQRQLLAAAAPLMRPGGTLVYSVCTLTCEETAGIDRWAAAELSQMRPLPPPGPPWQPAGRGGLLLPQAAGTDGMFVLSLQATR